MIKSILAFIGGVFFGLLIAICTGIGVLYYLSYGV